MEHGKRDTRDRGARPHASLAGRGQGRELCPRCSHRRKGRGDWQTERLTKEASRPSLHLPHPHTAHEIAACSRGWRQPSLISGSGRAVQQLRLTREHKGRLPGFVLKPSVPNSASWQRQGLLIFPSGMHVLQRPRR